MHLSEIIFKILPSFLQKRILVHKFLKDCPEIPGLKIKVATTREEIQASMEILYQSYVAAGLQSENDWKVRATKHHLHPNAITILACIDGKPVGTLMVMPGGVIPLPIEESVDISKKFENRFEVFEVGSFAVLPEYSKKKGSLIIPLQIFVVNFVKRKKILSENWVALVHPRTFYFYKYFFGAEKISSKEIQVSSVKGARGIAIASNTKRFINVQRERAGKSSIDKIIYQKFCDFKEPEETNTFMTDVAYGISYVHSERDLEKIIDHYFSSELREHLLNEKEGNNFKNLFFSKNTRKRFNKNEKIGENTNSRRREFRYHCAIEVMAKDDRGVSGPMRIVDVSDNGLAVSKSRDGEKFYIGDIFNLSFKAFGGKLINIEGMVLYIGEEKVGMGITQSFRGPWDEFILNLKQRYKVDLAHPYEDDQAA